MWQSTHSTCLIAAVGAHCEDTVATVVTAGRLENQLVTGAVEVRLGVFPAERQLLDIGQMPLAQKPQGVLGLFGRQVGTGEPDAFAERRMVVEPELDTFSLRSASSSAARA